MDTKKFEQLKKNGFDRLSTEDIVTLTPEQAKKLREFLELKLSEQLEHLSMEGKESKMAMYCSALSRIIEEESGNSLSFTLMEAIGELSVKCYHIGQEEERKNPAGIDSQIELIKSNLKFEDARDHVKNETEEVTDRLMKFLPEASEDDRRYIMETVANYAESASKKALIAAFVRSEGGSDV